MDVLEKGECFEELDGEYKYAHTLVVYRVGDDIYHAITKSRFRFTAEVKVEGLSNVVLIPNAAYCPPFPPNFTRAPDPLPPNCYVKRPHLLSYDPIYDTPNASRISERVLKEAEVCETLKLNPHPNIAKYHGCQVRNGRITGICFTKYSETLMHRVNPKNRGKRAFTFDSRSLKKPNLQGVEKGVQHLHSLGLTHNDLNPSNIMYGEDTLVIIDFDSCRPVGSSLKGVGRTYEWYDESVQYSLPSNDLDALDEIREWLEESGSRFFKFKD
jgi:serine/threonine protein kinase